MENFTSYIHNETAALSGRIMSRKMNVTLQNKPCQFKRGTLGWEILAFKFKAWQYCWHWQAHLNTMEFWDAEDILEDFALWTKCKLLQKTKPTGRCWALQETNTISKIVISIFQHDNTYLRRTTSHCSSLQLLWCIILWHLHNITYLETL